MTIADLFIHKYQDEVQRLRWQMERYPGLDGAVSYRCPYRIFDEYLENMVAKCDDESIILFLDYALKRYLRLSAVDLDRSMYQFISYHCVD